MLRQIDKIQKMIDELEYQAQQLRWEVYKLKKTECLMDEALHQMQIESEGYDACNRL
jgi:hypothetical protein